MTSATIIATLHVMIALVSIGGGAWLTLAGAVMLAAGAGDDAPIALRVGIVAIWFGLILFFAGAILVTRLAA